MQYLIPIHRDKQVAEMVWRPIQIAVFEHVDSVQYLEVERVERTTVECDLCHTRINTTQKAISMYPQLPKGYALFQSVSSPDKPHDILLLVVCETCRSKKLPNIPVLKSLKAAKRAIDRACEVGGR
jgi:hypothetical protein